MTERDPFSGPLAGITGRLQKLRENNAYLESGDMSLEEKWGGLFFEIGMLVDLLDELAWKVSDMLPPEQD